MQDKKAQDIAVLDLRSLQNSIADFFIICSGNSDTQVDAISQSVEDEVYKEARLHADHREGKENKEWILLDYNDIICHVFKKDRRRFYALEDLWGDAKITRIADED